jgi:hypothetical protein
VTKGMGVVREIEALGSPEGALQAQVYIDQVTIVEG